MDDNFKKKIIQDLEKSGFGSELKARQIFSNRKFGIMPEQFWDIDGGGIYLDLDENKSREVDIISSSEVLLKDANGSFLEYFITCEIKKTKQPWIVFKGESMHLKSKTLTSSYDLSQNCMTEVLRNTKTLSDHMGYIGTGIHEAFKNPDQPSRWFSAFLTATKSSLEIHSEYNDDLPESSQKKSPVSSIAMKVVQPVVVIDGNLLSVALGSDNEPIINEEKYITMPFEFASKGYKRRSYNVDLVTLDNLDDYLFYTESLIDETVDGIYDYLEKENICVIAPEKRGVFRYRLA